MKNFVEAYREARAKKWKYMDAKRAGWTEPGKRTRENHAILVPRREAMEMADELATKRGPWNCGGSWNDWPEKWTTPWCAENVGEFSAENGARIARTAGQRKTRKSM